MNHSGFEHKAVLGRPPRQFVCPECGEPMYLNAAGDVAFCTGPTCPVRLWLDGAAPNVRPPSIPNYSDGRVTTAPTTPLTPVQPRLPVQATPPRIPSYGSTSAAVVAKMAELRADAHLRAVIADAVDFPSQYRMFARRTR